LALAVRWSLAGFAITLVIALATLCLWLRDPKPLLTRDAFDEAWERWEEANLADYDVEVEVQGRQPATYLVEVRNNEVDRALRNGYPLKQRRTHGTWSVPGMFDTIEIDLENVERATAPAAKADRAASGERDGSSELRLRATFDPQFGYPSYYHRGQLGGEDVVWRVRRFVVRSPASPSPARSPDGAFHRAPCSFDLHFAESPRAILRLNPGSRM
jgi:hypothetical protein